MQVQNKKKKKTIPPKLPKSKVDQKVVRPLMFPPAFVIRPMKIIRAKPAAPEKINGDRKSLDSSFLGLKI